jgi:hypothetical protein
MKSTSCSECYSQPISTPSDEGVESRKRSPIKRRRAEEEAPTAAAAARPAPVCSFVDFSVAQGEPEFIERGGKQVLNTTPPRFRCRCTSGCGKKTRMCCAAHSTPEALVPVCNNAGCLLRHASDHSSIIETKWGQFRAVRVLEANKRVLPTFLSIIKQIRRNALHFFPPRMNT